MSTAVAIPASDTPVDSDIQKKLDRVIIRLGIRWSFFAQIMAGLQYYQTQAVPTLATDGKSVYINKEFWEGTLTPDTQISGVAHELVHVVLEHVWRRGDRDHQLFNIACDFKVNQYLDEEGFILGDGWLRDRQFDLWGEEQIYNFLLKKAEENQKKDADTRAAGGTPQQPSPSPSYGGQRDYDNIKEFLGRGTEGKCGIGQDIMEPKGTKEEQEEDREGLRNAIIKAFNTYKVQGGGAGLAEYITGKITKVSIPWYSKLLEYMVKMTFTSTNWRRINRRELDRTGIITADIGSLVVDLVVIFIDTSGSIGQRTLDYFGGHINTILSECMPTTVRLIYCDCAVNKVVDIIDGEPVVLEVVGGGGTDFRPAFKYVEDSGEVPDIAIYLTDTFGNFPEEAPEYPVIWASIYSEERANKVPFGEFLFIDESE